MPVYKDNHCNRIAGRVGKTYGYEQKAGVAKKVSVAKTLSQAKVIAPKPKQKPRTAVKIVAKTPSKAKVIAPKAKRTPMTATKMVKKSTTPGNSLTGLTPAQMNAMTPEELFGKLPVALGKIVLDPKTTGIKVGKDEVAGLEERIEALRPRFEAIKAREIARKDWGSVKELKEELATKHDDTYGVSKMNKKDLIKQIAEHVAEKESGIKILAGQLYGARSRRIDKAAADKHAKVINEIKEADSTPARKPTEEERLEFNREQRRHAEAGKLMRGPAYAKTREESKLRLVHRFRNIINYIKQNPSYDNTK